VSLALRMPELIEADRPRPARGEEQRVAYASAARSTAGSKRSSWPVKREPGLDRPDLVLMTFHDLTPLRRVEEMRADFVANASHELRTPLAALSGFIETLPRPARDDTKARERFLAIMQEQALRMARLIDDLLSLSRIELNAHRRPDKPVDLVPIVRQVVDGLETLARDRGVSVNVEAANALLILGDRDELVACSRTWSRTRFKIRRARQARRYQARARHIRRRRAGSASRRARLRARHRAGTSAAADERFLSRRRHREPRPRRNRAWPGAGQAHPYRHRGRLTIDSAPGAAPPSRCTCPPREPRPRRKPCLSRGLRCHFIVIWRTYNSDVPNLTIRRCGSASTGNPIAPAAADVEQKSRPSRVEQQPSWVDDPPRRNSSNRRDS